MISTSGSHLIPSSAVNAYLTDLLPYTTLLTPNIPEALHLAKLDGHDFGDIESLTPEKISQLAIVLSAKVPWVLLKGGHVPNFRNGSNVVVDTLVSKDGKRLEFVSDYSNSKNTHGTGCTLACNPTLFTVLMTAAIAANLALGMEMEVAVGQAIDYVHGAILHAFPMGSGNGPLNHHYRQRNLPFTP
jgi:hydroxymethylpyrimidine kinase/phosphomethylpyrimidine kinase